MNDVRHSADDALPVDEFARLFRAARMTRRREKRLENEFIVVATGRLSLRVGALLHADPSWLDRDQQMIEVPRRDPCACRYCRDRAEERAARDDGLTYEDALNEQWRPKYPASVRQIPYGYAPDVVDVVETFFDEVEELDIAPSTVNRRLKRLGDQADLPGNIYPHALRATTATYWARQGMDPDDLQALMGWASIRVAKKYIRLTGRQVEKAMDECVDAPDDVLEASGDAEMTPQTPTEAITHTLEQFV